MGLFNALMSSKQQDEDEKELLEVEEYLLDKISDGDAENKHNARWGSSYRKNLTVEEVEEMAETVKLGRWGWGRN